MADLRFRCSNLDSYNLCHGKLRAEANCEHAAERDGGAADGTSKHAILAEHIEPYLNCTGDYDMADIPADVQAVMLATRQTMVREFEAAYVTGKSEVSLSFGCLTGHPDIILIGTLADGTRLGVVVDAKFGWGSDRSPADRNFQCIGYGVLAWHHFGLTRVIINLSAPNDTDVGNRFTDATMEQQDIDVASRTIRQLYETCIEPNAPRVVSKKACRYCDACGTRHCPESRGTVPELAKPDMRALARLADNPELLRLAEVADIATSAIEAIKAELKRRLIEHEIETDRWQVTKEGSSAVLGDSDQIVIALARHFGDRESEIAEDIIENSKLSITALVKMVRAKDCVSEQDARATVESVLKNAGVLTFKTTAPKLMPKAANK
ncbi:MAG: hypothetical protein ABIH03_06165 [Pseudomonadota bacterium]